MLDDKGRNSAITIHKKRTYDDNPVRHRLDLFLKSGVMTGALLFVIALTMLLIVFETNYEAQGEEMPVWVRVFNYCVLTFFLAEVAIRIFVERSHFPREFLNVVDFAVVLVDFVRLISQSTVGAGFLVLRAMRLIRVSKGIKVMMWMPELAHMIRGLVGALKALFWGSILMIFMLAVWGILATQLIHPLNMELTRQGVWVDADCARCPRAFATVGMSMLTFTQQIVAGDSWGLLTVPIIEHYPPTILFFTMVLLSVQLAIINLILAIVLDKANESRQESERELIAYKEKEQTKAQIEFMDICCAMDEDESGFLTLEEIMNGWDSNEDFRTTMKAMDIEKDDLEMVFRLMDCDGSGAVAYKEFVDQLFKMKTYDMRTMVVFIRFYVSDMWHKMRYLYAEEGCTSKRLCATRSQRVSVVGTLSQRSERGTASHRSERGSPSLGTASEHASSSPRSSHITVKHNIDAPLGPSFSGHSTLASAWAGEVDKAVLDSYRQSILTAVEDEKNRDPLQEQQPDIGCSSRHVNFAEDDEVNKPDKAVLPCASSSQDEKAPSEWKLTKSWKEGSTVEDVERLREDIQNALDTLSSKLEDQSKLLHTLPLLLERTVANFLPPCFLPPPVVAVQEESLQKQQERRQKQPKAKASSMAVCCRPQREQVVSVT